MFCNLYLLFCIVGGFEIAPDVYQVELLNTETGVVHEILVPIKNDENL